MADVHMPPRTGEHSAAAIQVPADQVYAPQLPASLAKHPLALLAATIAAIVTGAWAVSPSDNKDAIAQLNGRLTLIEQSQATISADQGEMKGYLQRHLDKHEDRIKSLERRADGADRYHDTTDRYMRDYSKWQQEVRQDFKDLRRQK